MLICSLVRPRTLTGFIDRFLVAAESYRIPVILVFNKTDLYGEKEKEELDELTQIYRDVGYDVLHTSVPEKKNLELFKEKLKDKTTLLSGNSGVGKSTLINTIEPSLNLKTRPVSDYHKSGKHTTTYSEMFALTFGGYIIDTPGIRGFGLVEVEKNEIYHFFPEIFKYSKGCEYYNCTHTHEPGCNVRKAVEEGKIAVSRYNSYLDLYFDEEKKYR
jgi:ribosome biogenesis GTPase